MSDLMDFNKEQFNYVDSSGIDHQVNLDKEDFKQIQLDKKIHDVKFETKPTTYFKDAMRRFVKNKSSVIGGIILGVIVLLTLIVPFASQTNIENTNYNEQFLYPKLFPTGTGFWDGTVNFENPQPYDTVNETPAGFNKNAVSNLVTWEDTTNTPSAYASGGYVRFIAAKSNREGETRTLESYGFTYDRNSDYTVNISLADIQDTSDSYAPANYNFYISYYKEEIDEETQEPMQVETYSYYYDSFRSEVGETYTVDLDEFIERSVDIDEISDFTFGIIIEADNEFHRELFIESIETICSDSANEFNEFGFDDATAQVMLTYRTDGVVNKNFWGTTGYKNLYGANVTYCTFTYDSYEANFGQSARSVTYTDIQTYINNGWMELDTSILGLSPTPELNERLAASFKVLDAEKCPVVSVSGFTRQVGVVITIEVQCEVILYKYYGYDSMPWYIFGTDAQGRDLINMMFTGLRTSLLLGIVVTVVNTIIGIVWGAISGYFGGWIDLTLERITDILGRIPWLVIMTICILYLGQNFITFALALCLTGWIGIAGTTRAQFYRFKGREYILASRTLGAGDFRLIFRHILPNSLGTLVTSFVFLIPSTIFSEASISYLGLGLSGETSFGVILSDNQRYINSYSYLILIPSVLMALLMVSFNLFGNGLRDAFNPSLKGSD